MPATSHLRIPRSALISWAKQEIQPPPDDDALGLRRALLDRLPGDGWMPAASVQYAFETLALGAEHGGRTAIAPGSGPYVVAAEKQLAEEVERFAGAFFRLAPQARGEPWRALLKRAAPFPSLVYRLQALGPGLTAVIPTMGHNPAVLDLAQHLAELFTLRPPERAKRRRFPGERLRGTIPHWRQAAAYITARLPELARLEPKLLQDLSGVETRTRNVVERRVAQRYAGPNVRDEIPEYLTDSAELTGGFEQRRRRASHSAWNLLWILPTILGVWIAIFYASGAFVFNNGSTASDDFEPINSGTASGGTQYYYSNPPSGYYNGGGYSAQNPGSPSYQPPGAYNPQAPNPNRYGPQVPNPNRYGPQVPRPGQYGPQAPRPGYPGGGGGGRPSYGPSSPGMPYR